MEEDVSSRTYAQPLRAFAPNVVHQLMIQDAVHVVQDNQTTTCAERKHYQ